MNNGVSTLSMPCCPGALQKASPGSVDAPVVATSGFVTGDENRLLSAVMQSWCGLLLEQPGNSAFETTDAATSWQSLASPLVLVGPTGSGKSHLAAGLAELAGSHRAVFATANDLRREFADAIGDRDTQSWHERLAAVPVVVIDDLDHLPTRGSFQQELLHLARDIESRGHKLVVTSARPVAHLAGWLPDLVNWFAGGLTLEIAPLGPDARRELIAEIAKANAWTFTPCAEQLLAEHATPEPRELFRLTTDLYRQFGRGARLEADTLAHFLTRRKAAQAPELREIIRVVARYYQIPLKQLTSASRQSAVVMARAAVIYLARSLTSVSYEQIGQHLGGRDHSTIMHSHRQTTERIAREAALRSAIDELTRLLRK